MRANILDSPDVFFRSSGYRMASGGSGLEDQLDGLNPSGATESALLGRGASGPFPAPGAFIP